MELIPHNLSLDIIGKRRFFLVLSTCINAAIIAGIAIWSFNWGVDFAGGSEIELKLASKVGAAEVRHAIAQAGFPDASVQVIGNPGDNSFLVRVGRIASMTHEQARAAEAALRRRFGDALASFGYDPEEGDRIELRFARPVTAADLGAALAAAGLHVQSLREVPGGYSVTMSGIADKIRASLQQESASGRLPRAELRRVEFVGPQVGRALRLQGILAVLYAALAILVYIAFRFDMRFAPGAVVAMFHDIIVVLGYFLVTRREFNLTSVAVLLTIVGYSVNDTIVVYDRIRENLRKHLGKSLPELINLSINETLSRTVLTSFATALSLVGLLVFGVGQIWDFAAAMMVGIITGTYSSIYIASPLTIWIESLRGKGHKSHKGLTAIG